MESKSNPNVTDERAATVPPTYIHVKCNFYNTYLKKHMHTFKHTSTRVITKCTRVILQTGCSTDCAIIVRKTRTDVCINLGKMLWKSSRLESMKIYILRNILIQNFVSNVVTRLSRLLNWKKTFGCLKNWIFTNNTKVKLEQWRFISSQENILKFQWNVDIFCK